jgi:predicted glycosyltransferase
MSNSPHPLLFAPIARRLRELGHEVGVTARDNAQTVELTMQRFPGAEIIGAESPRSRVGKARAIAARVSELRRWAREFEPDVALSHNSYAQIVAAKTLGVRVVTAMDYEGQPANHLAFRLADTILMPDAIPSSAVRRQGATAPKLRHYNGLKEEIYLGDFEPDPGVLHSIGIERDGRALVVVRTPPSRAAYHRFGNPLFGEVIERLDGDPGVVAVVLTRHREQREAIRALASSKIVVPERAVDSRSLMYEADLVIGAGGTMTREAALMGVPTYSIFAGDQPAVDRELTRSKNLQYLSSIVELPFITCRDGSPESITSLRAKAMRSIDAIVTECLAAGPTERDGRLDGYPVADLVASGNIAPSGNATRDPSEVL